MADSKSDRMARLKAKKQKNQSKETELSQSFSIIKDEHSESTLLTEESTSNIVDEDLVVDKPVDTVENIENVDVLEVAEPEITPAGKVKEESTTKAKREKTKKVYDSAEKNVSITITLAPEVNQYLELKSRRTGRSMKDLLIDMMTDEFLIADNKQINFEDEMMKGYMKTQHGTEKRTVYVPSSFRDDLKKYAMKYYMKYTAFISYVITKNKLADKKFDL